jgi:hypothetical protein
MDSRASFFWARIMRTVLNEKHGEVLEHLRQDGRALVSMLSALAAHAASETEAGPLLWEMLTDEELAELAASVGAGPHLAGSLVSSLEFASERGDDEAISVGTRLIISMLELMPGHRISPHFRDAIVQMVPDALAALSISDPARLVLSIADILLAVLSPNSHDGGADSPRDCWEVGQGTAAASGADNELVQARALSSEDSVVRACQDAALGLLQRFVAIGTVDGTSLVRRRRRETSFQFTVMRPRGGRGGNATATRTLGDTASVADVRHATIDQASKSRRPNVAMASTARERRIAFAEEKEREAAETASPAVSTSSMPRLRVGTAELASVRAVGRLLQGGAEDWSSGDHNGYTGWIGQQFVAHGLGDVCIALLAEFEDREHDLLHCAVRRMRYQRHCCRRCRCCSCWLLAAG